MQLPTNNRTHAASRSRRLDWKSDPYKFAIGYAEHNQQGHHHMNPGKLRLFRLREITEAVGEQMDADRDRFDALRNRGPTRAVSAFNLFQTPEAIADRMAALLASLCDLSDDTRILEPSAGLGRLYRALRHRTQAHITLIEIAPQCAAELYRETAGDGQTTLIQSDFMDCTAERVGRVDAVLMNPPFKNGRDIRFYLKCLSLLNVGGIIIGLCYDGVKQRKILRPLCKTWEPLPRNSFKEEGTSADIVMVTLRKQ